MVERRKERRNADPLFEFGLLRYLSFRYGLLTTMVLAIGQLGFLFVLPVFLQDGLHLSAVENGFWLLPSGISIIVGTQIGARLTRRISVTSVVRIGLVLEALGLVAMVLAISPQLTFVSLLPGLVLFGIGIGFAGSQLTNVILSDIPNDRVGRGERREHHDPPARRGARHRDDRRTAHQRDDLARDLERAQLRPPGVVEGERGVSGSTRTG